MLKEVKRISILSAILILLVLTNYSLLFAAETKGALEKKNTPYTDVGKKILNVGGSNYHSVKRGDTVWGILIRENKVAPNYYSYYIKEFIKLNPHIKDINKIEIGQKLLIPDIVHKRKVKKTKKAKKKKLPAKKKLTAKLKPKAIETKKDVKKAEKKAKPAEKKAIEIKKPKKTKKAGKDKSGAKKKSVKKVNAKEAGKVSVKVKSVQTKAARPESVLTGSILAEAIESVSKKVVTKGVTYFPLGGGKLLKLNKSSSPFIMGGKKKVILDFGNKIKKEDEQYIKNRFKYYDFVDVNEGDTEKVVIGKVLKASGYYSVRENKDIKIGKNVKLVISYDWLIEKDPDSFLNGEVKLVKVKVSEDDKVPKYIKKYLEKYGFFVNEVKVLKKGSKSEAIRKNSKIISLSKSKSMKKMVRALLEYAEIKSKEDVTLKFHDEEQGNILANFYFEIETKGHIINLGGVSENTKNIAAKYGLKLLEFGEKENRSELIKKFFNLLQREYKYGTYRLLETADSKPFLDVELKGFLLGSRERESKLKSTGYLTLPDDENNVFITYYSLSPTIERLVTEHGYSVIQK